VLTDDDVDPQNKISLSAAQPPDEHGAIPRISATSPAFTARTRANWEFLTTKAVAILRAAGATKVVRAAAPPSLIHIHSSMRMGSDPATSVVDPNGEAHAVKRLFIADNSMLSNALGGPNPTLTTQAVATRTAERIVERYFRGRAWVDCQTPVSSIDDRVTRACVRRGL